MDEQNSPDMQLPPPQDVDPFRSKKEITRTFYASDLHEATLKPKKKGGEGGGISDLSMRQDLQQRRVEHSPIQQQQPSPANPNNESPAQLAMKRKRDMIAGLHDENTFVITQLPSKGGQVRQDEVSEAAEARRIAQQRYQEELRAQIEQRDQLRALQQKRPYHQEGYASSQRGSVLQEKRASMMQQRESQYQMSQYQSQRGSELADPGPRLLQRPLQTSIRPIATEMITSPLPQRYENYEPLQVMAGASRDHTPTRPQQYFNPQNVLLFQKINSFIDIEMQQLRTQAQSQQKMMLLQLQNLHSEASRIRFEATDHLQTLQQKKEEELPTKRVSQYQTKVQQNRTTLIAAGESILNPSSKSALDRLPSSRGFAYEPTNYHAQYKSNSYGLNDTYLDRQQQPIMISKTNQSPPQKATPSVAEDDFENDDAFAVLKEIEKMTEQNEQDMQRYQNYTEKRYNTERFIEEMELRKDFPGLELEQEDLLRRYDAKADGKKLEYNMLRGRDIVFELLEQSLVHENLDKVRRDLDEFSYKNKDSSYLLSLPYMNPSTRQPIIPLIEQMPKTPPKPVTPVTTQEEEAPEKSALIKLHQLPVLDLSQAPNVEDQENLLYTLGDPPVLKEQEVVSPTKVTVEKKVSEHSLVQKSHEEPVAHQDAFELPMDEPSPERNLQHIKSAERLPQKQEEEYDDAGSII